MSSITMSAAVERGMRLASVEFALEVIGQLSSEGVLKCSLDDAIKMFDFDSVAVVSSRSKASKKRESSKSVKKVSSKITAKPTVILPFCGEIQGGWCNAVKFNHGLHTQCTMGPSGEDIYCKTCRKHADNSATGKPPYGDINDRAEFNVDYRDPKGKLTLPYANVVEKLGINMEAAVAAATTLGWTIPAEQLVKRTSKRGRPTKSAAVSDSDSDSEETPKKKRGRPSKAKVAAPTQEDQIAQLVAEAYAETTTKSAVKVKKVKKLKVKKPKLTDEQKASVKLAKKEAADKLKAEKKEAADQLKAEKKEAADKLKAEKKEAADKLKAEKKEAADKLKAEKKEAADKLKAEKAAANLAKKEAADQLKAEKAAANLAKKEAADKLKEEKLVAKALEKEAKEAATAKLKAEKKAIALKARQEKAAAKKAEREAAKLRKKEAADKLKAEKAETSDASSPEDAIVFQELEEEVILEDSEFAELEVDSSDDEEEGETELSETMTVGGVEYFFSEMDGQTVLFTKTGEPVGVYDADTDTIQECEFDDE